MLTRKAKLNFQTQVYQAKHAIALALENCEHPVVSTKFGSESATFLHLMNEAAPGIPVIWVDTGYNTRATCLFAEKLTALLQLNLHKFEPKDHTIIIPPALDDPDHGAFVQTVKIAPFKTALQTLHADAWFSSIRRYQTDHRQSLDTFDTAHSNVLKVSPMLHWTRETVACYGETNSLPVGPECFDPTKGLAFRECGLHTEVAS